MATLKFSRQRESIKDYLARTTDHPTADMVYSQVRQEYPHISLGTVYRNLNLLAELGEIIKITTPDGGDRFDGNIEPHYHFICSSCHKVIDMDLENMDYINQVAAKNFNGEIESHAMIFYGRCDQCLN